VILKKGQGLITYGSAEEAEMAISAFNGSEIGGASIQTDSWAAKQPKGREAKGAKNGKGSAKGVANGGGKAGGKDSGAKGTKGAWAAAGKGKFGGAYPMPPAAYGRGAYGTPMFAGWGGPTPSSWAAEPPAKQKWTPPVGSTEVHWLSAPEHSPLLAQGLPQDAPAVVYVKGDTIFSSSTHILSDIVGNIAAEVQIIHDADWEQYPEIGEVVKAAVGEENCFAVAICASRATWGIGVANGWKGRESAAKLALSLAFASQDPGAMGIPCKNNPDFATLCRKQGFPVAPGRGNGVAFAAGGSVGGGGAAGMATEDIPPVHFITVPGDSKVKEAGLPAEAPAIFFTKSQKEYFSNAHSILQEFVEDVKEEVAFEDDADGGVFPEIHAAVSAAGAEQSGLCVASNAEQGVWGVGLAHGHDGRMRAAKLALGLAMCQNQGKLEEFAQKYPEFGRMCASAGLVEMPAKRRKKGGW